MFFEGLEQKVKHSITQRDKDRTNFLRSFLNLILEHEYIVIFHHVNPDGDCLGAAFGFQEIMRSNFPEKKVYVVGDSNGMYPWMHMMFDNRINYDFDFSLALAIVFDVGQSHRVEKFNKFFVNSRIKFGSVVRIDHHNCPCDFNVDLTWDDPTYASTCCQVVQIADFYGWRMNKKASTFLYLGICTDTLRFSTESSLPRTLILAAKTWRNGADYVNVNKRLNQRTWDDIRISNHLLENCTKTENIIWHLLTLEEMNRLGIKKTKGLVSNFNNIEEHWIWILFIECEDGMIKVDFRSKNVPIRDLAIKFGGGGHDFAAGATIERRNVEKIVSAAETMVSNAKKKHVFREFLDIGDVDAVLRDKRSMEASKVSPSLLAEAKRYVKDERGDTKKNKEDEE